MPKTHTVYAFYKGAPAILITSFTVSSVSIRGGQLQGTHNICTSTDALDDLAYTSDPTICVYLLADVKAFTSTPHAAFLQAPSCIATPPSHPPRQPLLMHFQHVYQISYNKCSGFTYPVNRGLRAGYFLSHAPFALARLTRALIFQTLQLFVHVDDNTIVAASQAQLQAALYTECMFRTPKYEL